MRMTAVMLVMVLAALGAVAAAEDPPRSHDPRIAISLFAEEPQIVTPTGIDVDAAGRVWAVESNTHFPPEGYKGHPTDRVLVMTDTDGDGKCDQSVTFIDGLIHTMSVAVLPVWLNLPKSPDDTPDTVVYLATRKEIFRCLDTNGDLVCDEKTSIVRLDTKGDYPHDGIAGFAFDPLGQMYFGFGENLGADYEIVGSDGSKFSGGGEGGNLCRCQLDGTKLTQWATGFWNPHASCVDKFGRLFTVDNDADSRPPCRLLHIIEGGDYGYRYRNGRKGLHPFTSWNGEIPGTLPMVAGTGEAPSGICCYESDGFPAEYRGQLLVTSWGDHRIDRFQLKWQGSRLVSNPEPLISGGENFRPVGIALAPDGSLFCTDWVLRDYNLHGRGRVWKIRAVAAPKSPPMNVARLAKQSREEWEDSEVLEHPRVDVRRTAARSLARGVDRQALALRLRTPSGPQNPVESRLEALWAISTAGLRTSPDRFISTTEDENVAAAAVFAGVNILPANTLGSLTSIRSRLGGKALPPPLALAICNAQHLAKVDEVLPLLVPNEPFLFGEAVRLLAAPPVSGRLADVFSLTPVAEPRLRLAATLAARRANPADTLLATALRDPDAAVRRAAVQWVAEAKRVELRPQVEAILNDEFLTADLFLATLAAIEMLDGIRPEDFDKTPPGKYVLPIVGDARRPPSIRALALRLVPPSDPGLTAGLLAELLGSSHAGLRTETVRTLQGSPLPEAAGMLRQIAGDNGTDPQQRLDAISGLATVAEKEGPGGDSRILLSSLLADAPSKDIRREAIRSLRSFPDDGAVRKALEHVASTVPADDSSDMAEQVALALGEPAAAKVPSLAAHRESRPTDPSAWKHRLSEASTAGDAEAGRRLFFHAKGPGCATCHTVNGRGGRIGPDLSTIGRSLSREKLIDSILEPSKEIAPQFVSWTLETKDGKTLSGMIVFENEGRLTLGTSEGKTIEFPNTELVDRRPQEKSVMPDKLADRLTVQEFRDLLAFLESLK